MRKLTHEADVPINERTIVFLFEYFEGTIESLKNVNGLPRKSDTRSSYLIISLSQLQFRIFQHAGLGKTAA